MIKQGDIVCKKDKTISHMTVRERYAYDVYCSYFDGIRNCLGIFDVDELEIESSICKNKLILWEINL